MELTEGRRILGIQSVPDRKGSRTTLRTGLSAFSPIEIVVVMEAGAAGPVPWARVQWLNGRVELVNLATVESVVLEGPTPAAPFETKGSGE